MPQPEQPTDLPISSTGRSARDVAVICAREAGKALLSHFKHTTAVRWKGKSNVATDADVAAEQAILAILKREFREHEILAEESGKSEGGSSEYTWLVDPLDGTNNFLFGIPFFAVTLALTRGDDTLLGVTYDPVRDELFHTVRGQSAMLNYEAVSASGRDKLESALVGFDLGYSAPEGRLLLDLAGEIWAHTYGMRLLGSAALGLAYAAAGRLDIYCHRCLYPWDIGAGILLVRNAGGIVTDWDGKAATSLTSQLVAGNRKVHGLFREWFEDWQAAPHSSRSR